MSEDMMNGVGAPKTSAPPSPPIHRSGADNEAGSAGIAEAIFVRNACKSYGVGKRRSTVLRGLDMNVKKGTIYGLLGASGCGKTTLLSCIVGRRSFDSGEVLVFGGEPGSVESGIPGPRVGYMPQELALYGEFTIKETLQYFGRIYNLPAAFVKSQMEFLFNLLDLPPGHRYVKTLSGGQQRRVSFAVALFHEPELLILDEPTVGVDPLLRQSIWNHLVRLSTDHGRTVIITTHYIEEARQAHTIGLMRSGHLLAEESPHNLLSLHGLSTLEDVFLKLCMKDGVVKHATAPVVATITNGKTGYPNMAHQQDLEGHDNPAYVQTFNNVDAITTDIDHQHHNSQDEEEDPTALAQLSIIPFGAQYWKNTKSILPVADEDGIVGLTFSPSGDSMVHTYSNKASNNQQQHINQMNAFNNHGNDDSATATFDTKEGLFNLKHGGSSTNGSSSSTASCSSSSSNAGDTSSSCGSTAASSRAVGKRRSGTFKLAIPSWHRSSALIRKNFMQTFRNIGMFLFIFLLPAAQAILFCLAIGRDPSFLKMAIVNDELDPSQGRICNYTTDCSYSMFSCRYLRFIDNTTIVQVPFKSLSDAIDATKRGEVWGVVHFGQNFTDELVVRQADGNHADNETILASRIAITLDWSNQQISLTLQRRLIEAFEDFSKDVLSACSYEPAAASIPVTFLDPIYGEKKPSFTEFMAPGIILTIVYFIAVALTAAVFINERKSGLLDRSIVAGVQMTEIMLAHLVNQFTVLIGQTALVFLFMLLVFNIACHGSLALAVFITLLQGLCGMSYGLVVSTLCDEETSAIHLSLGSFYPNLLLSGVLWPMEGMPVYLRYVSYFLPQTYAVESLRNVFGRGWGIERPEVYFGIVISFSWIFALLALSLIVVRIRKYTG
ncbi:ABC transporter G family member 20-like isoform X3 [Daphnia pulicaria]|nr:ABC transporter G family member 20-like isoform X3 [Daphnia pulicaria]XP_046646483.1 ABC transporter G family member 20-like isoform X3 [Daphnia pulicaria]